MEPKERERAGRGCATGTATARRRPQRTHLVKVEDEVELAHVAEELVEQLDEKVDGLKVQELVVVHVNGQREEEAGVPAVDELVRPELNKVGKLGVAGSDNPVDLGFDLQPLLVGVGAVVLAQPRLALTVLQQDELEHGAPRSMFLHTSSQVKSSQVKSQALTAALFFPFFPRSPLVRPSSSAFFDIIAAEQGFETKHRHPFFSVLLAASASTGVEPRGISVCTRDLDPGRRRRFGASDR